MAKGRYSNNDKIKSNIKKEKETLENIVPPEVNAEDSSSSSPLNRGPKEFLQTIIGNIFGYDKLVEFPGKYFSGEKIYESELNILREIYSVDLNDYRNMFVSGKDKAVLNLSNGCIETYGLFNYSLNHFPEKFSELKSLKTLIIDDSSIDNLDYVLDIKGLESISLNHTALTKGKLDIDKIMAMTSLKYLDIRDMVTNLTNIELKKLSDYCKLKNIRLRK
ncbi:MAG: hypothetical protein WC393_01800 [Candidatus Nanoarchaeia archaeon]|jgi:hypothetical protein